MPIVYPKILLSMCIENWLALIIKLFFMLESLVIGISILSLLFFSVVVVNQGTIAIITMFGKYQRIMLPGLRFKI